MPHVKQDTVVSIWPNKDAEVEQVTFGPADALSIVEDWGELILVRDDDGRTFQLRADQVER